MFEQVLTDFWCAEVAYRMRFAKPCFLLSALLLALSALTSPLAAQERSIVVDGIRRAYILHIPRDLPEGPRPLVIALHGALQPAGTMQRYLDLDAVADREGFIVAYPKGMNLLWNDGRSSIAGFIPLLQKRDDAHFVVSVLDKLVADGMVDPSRAYLMGFSNGGFLTAFMACRNADRFAAFATMMMTVPIGYSESCKPARPVPILMMNGTYDPIVPMFGRPTPGARLMSADSSALLFARLNGCATPVATQAPNTRIIRWNECKDGAAVAYYRIAGGHQPPSTSTGAMDALAAVVLGPRRSGLDAPEEIWKFFKRFGGPPPTIEPSSALALAPQGHPAPQTFQAAAPMASTTASSTHVAPAPTQIAISAPMSLRPTAAPAAYAVTPVASASVPLPPPSPLRRKAASVE